MWVCTQLGNAFGLISYNLLCMCVCMCIRRQCVYTCICAIINVGLSLCAVLMDRAATLGGLVASAGHSRGNTEDLASMQ